MKLKVLVKPNQRSEGVDWQSDNWVIRLKARAQDGEANRALVIFLSSLLNISKSGISIVNGKNSHHKLLEIQKSEAEVVARLKANLPNKEI